MDRYLALVVIIIANIFIQHIFAECAIKYDIPNTIVLPSVSYIGDEFDEEEIVSYGEPMVASLRFVDGNGTITFQNGIKVKEDTIDSIRTALDLVIKELNYSGIKRNCNIIIEIRSLDGQKSKYTISGPSGGLGFYILLKAELEQKNLRKDSAITGAITQNGLILPVGGYYYKAKLLYPKVKYFVVPQLDVLDQLFLQSYFSSSNGLKIIEVQNVTDAYKFFTREIQLKPKDEIYIEYKKVNLTNISYYNFDNKTLFHFDFFVKNRIQTVNESIAEKYNTPLLLSVRKYLQDRLSDIKSQHELGYLYTAGNELFLLESELLAIDFALNDGDYYAFKGLINDAYYECQPYNALKQTDILFKKDYLNFLTGLNARYFWGLKKLKDIDSKIKSSNSKEELVLIAYDLGYAINWCKYSTGLFDYYVIDKSTKKELVNLSEISDDLESLLKNYSKYSYHPDSEVRKYYNYAKESFESKDYFSSLFNLYFAKAIDGTFNDLSMNKTQRLVELSNYEYKGYWAKVYETQFRYLLQRNEVDTAIKIGNLAKAMSEMDDFIESRKFNIKIVSSTEKSIDNIIEIIDKVVYNKSNISSSSMECNCEKFIPKSLVSRDLFEKEKLKNFVYGFVLGFSSILILFAIVYLIWNYVNAGHRYKYRKP
ncbi:MAG: S16 family serine protease [Candidatus Anstonellales archaeon]